MNVKRDRLVREVAGETVALQVLDLLTRCLDYSVMRKVMQVNRRKECYVFLHIE